MSDEQKLIYLNKALWKFGSEWSDDFDDDSMLCQEMASMILDFFESAPSPQLEIEHVED